MTARSEVPTLADYLREGLDIVSIGINPSVNSARAGFYFATPRNRFWGALNASGLVPEELTPGREAVERLFNTYRIGFTDVAKRPSSSASHLTAEDFRAGAPVLRDKLLKHQPLIAWFHGKEAYGNYLRYAEGRAQEQIAWGRQEGTIGGASRRDYRQERGVRHAKPQPGQRRVPSGRAG